MHDSCTSRYCWACISYSNSVCLSVTTRYRFKPRWDRHSGFSPYDSLDSLVSYEVIWCRWVRRFPSNEGIKEGYPLRNRYFTTIGSCSVRTVADRHRLAAYHNKYCWRAFQWYQHRWPWTTLNPKIWVFSEFLSWFKAATHILRVNCAETIQDRPGQPAYEMTNMHSQRLCSLRTTSVCTLLCLTETVQIFSLVITSSNFHQI